MLARCLVTAAYSLSAVPTSSLPIRCCADRNHKMCLLPEYACPSLGLRSWVWAGGKKVDLNSHYPGPASDLVIKKPRDFPKGTSFPRLSISSFLALKSLL